MQTLQNPYLVQNLANVTGINVEPVVEPAEPGAHIQQDNLCTQNVEVRVTQRLDENTTNTLLEASKDFDDMDPNYIRALMISSFNRIFQPQSEADKGSWDDIVWDISEEHNILQATSDDDAYFFYFQFFTREDAPDVQWLRVYYEGRTELDRIYDTTQNTRLSSFIFD